MKPLNIRSVSIRDESRRYGRPDNICSHVFRLSVHIAMLW